MAGCAVVASIVAAFFVGVSTPLASPALAATNSWNPSDVFTSATPTNPGPDSYGHADVWQFSQGTGLDTSTYSLLPQYSPSGCGISGFSNFADPSGLPAVAYNGTGADLVNASGPGCNSTISVASRHLDVHPLSNDVVVSWTAPIAAQVNITAKITDADVNGGDGIAWAIGILQPNSGSVATAVATGSFPNGGSSDVPVSAIGTRSISQGTRIVLVVDANGSPSYDSTDVLLNIATAQGVTPPAGGPLTSRENGAGAGGNPAESCSCVHRNAADPVDTAFGSLSEQLAGVAVPGRGPALDWNTSYSSSAAAVAGPVGFGWTSSYAAHLAVDGGTGNVTVTQENGSQIVFAPVSGGGYAPTAPRVRATLTKQADGSFALVRQADQTLQFSPAGNLMSIADRNGETTTLGYTGGVLSTVTDPAGRALTVTWAGGHVATVTDPAGHKVSYAYSTAGDLTSVTAPDGGVTKFGYDTAHEITSMTDPVQSKAGAGGTSVVMVWDGQGRVMSQTDQLNRKTTFAYTGDNSSSAGGTTLVTDPAGHQTLDSYQYGERSSTVAGYSTPAATTTSYVYDPNTLGVTSISVAAPSDPNDHHQSFTYNSDGLPLTAVDGMGRTTTTTYNTFHEPLTVTTPNPSTVGPTTVATTYTYDARGNTTSAKRPLYTSATAFTTQATSWAHATTAHPGDVTSMTAPGAAVTTYTYDTAGNQTSVTSPEGRQSTAAYDGVGRRVSSVAPKGTVTGGTPAAYTTSYTYDAVGRLLNQSVADGTTPLVTKHTYDPDGRELTETDPLGRVTTTTYDAAGQLSSTRRPDGTSVSSTYFPDGVLASQKDALGHTTTYREDPLGRTTAVTDPRGRTTTSTLDGIGAVLSSTDPQNQVTTNAYDNAADLTSTTYSDGHTPTVTRTYNRAGRQTSMVDGSGTTTDSFDSLDRLTARTATPPTGTPSTVTYGYTLRDKVSALTYPGNHTVAHEYNRDNDLISLTDWLPGSGKTSFTYDQNDNLISTLTPNGVTAAISYDPADRSTGHTFTHATTTLATLAYTRDAADELTKETTTGLGATRAFTYNTLGQVTAAGGQPYGYATSDNLTKNNATTQNYDIANQLTTTVTAGATTTTYGYDPRGNRTTATGGRTATWGYDQANRLTSYTSGATTAAYTYDGDGERRSKTVGTTNTRYAYDDTDLPLLLTDATTNYLYGPGGIPLEQITGTTRTFLHTDQLGSVRLLTNAAGTTAGTVTYTTYGTPTPTGAARSALGYAGEYTDTETGLQYLRARYYDPTTATFLTRDPLDTLTRQTYTYAIGNPINYTDPSGLGSFGELVTAFKPAIKSVAKGLAKGTHDVGQLAESGLESMLKAADPSSIAAALDIHIIQKTRDLLNCIGNNVSGAGTPGFQPTICYDTTASMGQKIPSSSTSRTGSGGTANYFGHYGCDEYGNTEYIRDGFVQGGAWHKGW